MITASLVALHSFSKFTYAQSGSGEYERPNIMVIMGNDFDYSDIGVFGSEISTHNLDQLSRIEKC